MWSCRLQERRVLKNKKKVPPQGRDFFLFGWSFSGHRFDCPDHIKLARFADALGEHGGLFPAQLVLDFFEHEVQGFELRADRKSVV